MRERRDTIPPASRGRISEALERLAELHERRGHVEEAQRLRAVQ
jgi:hypothetical protein